MVEEFPGRWGHRVELVGERPKPLAGFEFVCRDDVGGLEAVEVAADGVFTHGGVQVVELLDGRHRGVPDDVGEDGCAVVVGGNLERSPGVERSPLGVGWVGRPAVGPGLHAFR